MIKNSETYQISEQLLPPLLKHEMLTEKRLLDAVL
jgi:hypothetical protein